MRAPNDPQPGHSQGRARIHRLSCEPPAGSRAALARTPPDTVIYAVGDVHGRADLLKSLHAAIAADACLRPSRRRVLIHLGDYVSRGRSSRRVLDMVRAPLIAGFETVCLRGNHEELAVRFLEGDLRIGAHWLDYGGAATLRDYGVEVADPRDRGPETMEHLRQRLSAAMPPDQIAFLRGLALFRREGDYFFVHAGLRPGVPLDRQTEHDMTWIRKPFTESEVDFGVAVVHGHTISEEPQARANRIGIDTGAYDSGVLTCLALEGEERGLIQARRTGEAGT